MKCFVFFGTIFLIYLTINSEQYHSSESQSDKVKAEFKSSNINNHKYNSDETFIEMFSPEINRKEDQVNIEDDYDVIFDPLPSSKKNLEKFTIEEYQNDLLWHVHLIKIFNNKITSDITLLKSLKSTKNPIFAHLKIELTTEFMKDLDIYINKSDRTIASKLNHYFMNNMIIENHQSVMPIMNETSIPWYETNIFLFSLAIFLVLTFMLMSKSKFIIIVIVVGFCHKGLELYEQEELEKSIFISQIIPKYCINEREKSVWNGFKNIFRSNNMNAECLQYFKQVKMKTHHKVNIFKIFSVSISEMFVTLSQPIGEITGVIYGSLSKHLPWYLTPLILLTLIVVPVTLMAWVVVRIGSVWLIVSSREKTVVKQIEKEIEESRNRSHNQSEVVLSTLYDKIINRIANLHINRDNESRDMISDNSDMDKINLEDHIMTTIPDNTMEIGGRNMKNTTGEVDVDEKKGSPKNYIEKTSSKKIDEKKEKIPGKETMRDNKKEKKSSSNIDGGKVKVEMREILESKKESQKCDIGHRGMYKLISGKLTNENKYHKINNASDMEEIVRDRGDIKVIGKYSSKRRYSL